MELVVVGMTTFISSAYIIEDVRIDRINIVIIRFIIVCLSEMIL